MSTSLITESSINKPIECGICKKTVWLLNLKVHLDEAHDKADPNPTNTAWLKEVEKITNAATQGLEMESGKRKKRNTGGGKRKKRKT